MHPLLFHSKASYFSKLKGLFGSSLIAYWPLRESSGSVVNDLSGNGRTGSYTSVTLAQPGPGGGLLSGRFDGASSYCNVYSDSLRDALNGSAGTYMLRAKVSEAGIWTDATARSLLRLNSASGNSLVALRRSTADNTYQVQYTAGATAKTFNLSGLTSTDFLHIAATWDAVSDHLIAYLEGVAVGSPTTGLGAWGADVINTAIIGASSLVPAQPYKGYLCDVLLLNRVATPLEVARVQSFFA
jgi:Concanavalin A-like lectin/glucanases superfamily